MKKDNKFMTWMSEKFAPKLQKIVQNPYVASVQESIMTVLPMIMIGSFITILDIARSYSFLAFIPDLHMINQFSFGLMAMFIAFMLPLKIIEKTKKFKFKNIAALTSVGVFLILLMPTIDMDTVTMAFSLDKIGTGGMILAVVVGLITGKVFKIASDHSFFKEDTVMPDIIVNMFDSMIPVTLMLLVGTVCFKLNFDVYAVIRSIFSPLTAIAQTIPGTVLIAFSEAFLYTFGFTWILFPIQWTVWMSGIAANMSAVAAGHAATNFNLMETANGMFNIGGVGATLPLVFLMLSSKSKRLKAIGKITILPSLLNINEPVVYGAPIAFNPILMIPMWLNAALIPLIGCVAYATGIVTIPSKIFQLWYLPTVIQGFVNSGLGGVILCIVLTCFSLFVWIPFFKVYERQVLKEESKK